MNKKIIPYIIVNSFKKTNDNNAIVENANIKMSVKWVVDVNLFENTNNNPKIKRILEILLPIIVPITNESEFVENKIPEIAVNSSGREVPIAIIVRPMINFDNPALCPNIEAEINKKSADLTKI